MCHVDFCSWHVFSSVGIVVGVTAVVTVVAAVTVTIIITVARCMPLRRSCNDDASPTSFAFCWFQSSRTNSWRSRLCGLLLTRPLKSDSTSWRWVEIDEMKSYSNLQVIETWLLISIFIFFNTWFFFFKRSRCSSCCWRSFNHPSSCSTHQLPRVGKLSWGIYITRQPWRPRDPRALSPPRFASTTARTTLSNTSFTPSCVTAEHSNALYPWSSLQKLTAAS